MVCTDWRVRKLLENYIPAIEDEGRFGEAVNWEWKDQPKFGEEINLLGRIVSQGHMKEGAANFHVQGFYAITPKGKLLCSSNPQDDPADAIDMLTEGLARWKKLGRQERLRPAAIDPSVGKVSSRNQQLFPKDGLALRAYTRDLPAPHIKAVMPSATGTNFYRADTCWFRKDEVAGFLPPQRTPGARRQVAPLLVERLVRFYVGGNTDIQIIFEKKSINKAVLFAEVAAVKSNWLELVFSGESKAAQQGDGYAGAFYGKAVYDTGAERFVTFDLVSVGTRTWKNDEYHGKASPLGIALTLEEKSPFNKEPPFYLRHYGWK